MPVSFHDISVGCYVQTVGATRTVLAKGLEHCTHTGTDPQALVETRLAPDMLPLRFQVQSVIYHSVQALAALRAGTFAPPASLPEHDYAGLQAALEEAEAHLRAETPEAVNALAGGTVVLRARGTERHFTAEGFVLSFSVPNLHFHAATAYAILRAAGVPLGKRDFLGQLRLIEAG